MHKICFLSLDKNPFLTKLFSYNIGIPAKETKFIIVAHSMGGLVARAYLRRHGGSKVARLITLGTGHHGSVLACLGIGRNARQMEPGSPWLESLARETLPVPTTSIYSRHDNFVMPQASAVLSGARIIALVGVGHLSMGCSPAVLACIEAELNSA